MLEWMDEHKAVFIWLTVVSAVFFVASIVAVGVVVVRMPADYFEQQKRKRDGKQAGPKKGHPAMRTAWRIARNVLGWLLIVSGLVMLVAPGQGVLVLFIGVMLADFPGKYRLERWIISRGRVLKTINWLRRKFERPALKVGAEGRKPPDSSADDRSLARFG